MLSGTHVPRWEGGRMIHLITTTWWATYFFCCDDFLAKIPGHQRPYKAHWQGQVRLPGWDSQDPPAECMETSIGMSSCVALKILHCLYNPYLLPKDLSLVIHCLICSGIIDDDSQVATRNKTHLRKLSSWKPYLNDRRLLSNGKACRLLLSCVPSGGNWRSAADLNVLGFSWPGKWQRHGQNRACEPCYLIGLLRLIVTEDD